MKGIKPEKAGSLTRKLLRLLRASISSQEPVNLQTQAHAGSLNPLFTNASLKQDQALLYWHEVRKAEALFHWQNLIDRPR